MVGRGNIAWPSKVGDISHIWDSYVLFGTTLAPSPDRWQPGRRPERDTMDNSTPAVERACEVLEAVFAHADGVTAGELAARTRIPRTTLYRILRVLAAKGYLAKGSGVGTYVLGHALTRMARGTTGEVDLVSTVKPAMDALSAKVRETTKLVLREGMESYTIAVKTPFDDRVASQVGTRGPLHIGASQRLLLSRAPERVQTKVLAQPLLRMGPGSITNPVQLKKNLAELATRDWELGYNEGIRGVGTVGALIREPGRDPRAALAIVFIVEGRSERDIGRFKIALRETARTLSRLLGAS